MNDEQFFDQLRGVAGELRYEPADPATFDRLAARISAAVEDRPGIFPLLAGWFRPVALAATLTLLVSASLLTWLQSSDVDSLETVAQAQLLQEDFYSGLQ